MTEKKSPISLITALLIALCVMVGIYFFTSFNSKEVSAERDISNLSEDVADEASAIINVEAALSDRIMGNPNAPIKISEHSSLTCGHCGSFHKGAFKELKKAFIDTGKAYIVYSDFPLNAPALHAGMVARCLRADRYFDFLQMLFETQEVWAHERDYIKYLQSKSAEYGLHKDSFKACITNEGLQEGIVARQRASQAQWKINSTPSFVINNQTVIAGALPFEEFEKIINEELKKLEDIEGSDP